MPPEAKRQMREALRKLATDPSGRSMGLDVKMLRTTEAAPVYRLRIGEWRAAWQVRGNVLQVVRVFHRSEGYGWLERMYP
ncbi:MAG: type II toxin-antitoxin system RelE/ParE family toxin [Halobacteriales archaeon]|nr:type II toxin-antitoxin system RelE/ParE family toxin [Halobacteriales archaeon]